MHQTINTQASYYFLRIALLYFFFQCCYSPMCSGHFMSYNRNIIVLLTTSYIYSIVIFFYRKIEQIKIIKYSNLIDIFMINQSKSPIMKVIKDIPKQLTTDSYKKRISSKRRMLMNKKNDDPKKNLKSCLTKFKKCYFGKPFIVNNICFNSPITHHLLLRQVMCSDLQVMQFNFNGKRVCFITSILASSLV